MKIFSSVKSNVKKARY